MASTGYFFPKRLLRHGLGLQGGIGTRMSVIQLVGPSSWASWSLRHDLLAPQQQVARATTPVSTSGSGAAAFFIPAACRDPFRKLPSSGLLTCPSRPTSSSSLDIFSNPTWYMTILYVS